MGAHAGRKVGGAAVGCERATKLAQPHLHIALAPRAAAQHQRTAPLHTAWLAEMPGHRDN
jgi:hypothetical protein